MALYNDEATGLWYTYLTIIWHRSCLALPQQSAFIFTLSEWHVDCVICLLSGVQCCCLGFVTCPLNLVWFLKGDRSQWRVRLYWVQAHPWVPETEAQCWGWDHSQLFFPWGMFTKHRRRKPFDWSRPSLYMYKRNMHGFLRLDIHLGGIFLKDSIKES